jgi:polyphenol oxidase
MIDPPQPQPTTVNLGGGFVYLRRADGHSAIVASGLAGSGAIGIMSTADVDARADDALRRWLQWWAFPDHARLRRVNQVHGGHVIDAASYNGAAPDADGIWTRSPADVLVIKAADCAPVWLIDPRTKTIALIHAGWRGVAAGIVERAVEALVHAGASPQVRAAVGPRIGSCCFEVGPEVAERFAHDPGGVLPARKLVVRQNRPDGLSLDLGAIIAHRLSGCGVGADAVMLATACTRCHHEILHSYRRNGSGGPLMAAVGAVLP